MSEPSASIIEFNVVTEEVFQELVASYPTREAALLPTLWLAMDQFGALSDGVLEYVASRLELPPVRVFSVVEFYTMFKRKPLGRYHFQVCQNLTCTLRGSEPMIDTLKEKLGVQPGEVTADGNYSLELVECLGSCGTAPVIRVNDTYFENVTMESLVKMISGCKEGRDSSKLLE
ncbi:MAG: NAD(P)H-dependent oxidoreductase subunit E [Candidatus Latescibacterota bacterium]